MYQFPKEQTFFGKQNSWCDKNQGDETGYTIFLPKDRRKLPKEHNYWLFCLFWTNRYSIYSVNSAIGSRIDGIIFRSFQKQKRSQKNTITGNSVYSQLRIVPKERAPNWLFWSTMLFVANGFNFIVSFCGRSFNCLKSNPPPFFTTSSSLLPASWFSASNFCKLAAYSKQFTPSSSKMLSHWKWKKPWVTCRVDFGIWCPK